MAIAGTTGWWWVFCLKVRYALALVGLGCDQYRSTYYVMGWWGSVGVIQISVENESVLGSESGSESILWPDFSTNPDPNRFFHLKQILKSL